MRNPQSSLFLLVCLSLVVVLCALTTLGQAAVSDEFRLHQPIERAVDGASSLYQFKPTAKPTTFIIQLNQNRSFEAQLNEDAVRLFYRRERESFAEAVEKWQQAAAIARARGDRQQEGQALRWMGRALYVLSEYRAALAAFSQAAQAFHDARDRVEEGRCLFDLAVTHGTLVELSQAEKYHFQAVQIWREINEPELPLRSAYNVGRAYRLTGDWQKARDMFNQLLALARAYPQPIQSKYYEQQALSELGYTAVGAGHPQPALDYFAQALPGIQADLDHPYDTPFVLNQIAQAWLKLGNANKAHDHCQKALQSARRIGQRRAEAVTLTTLGQVYTAIGRRPEAQAALTQAQALNAAMGFKRDQPATALRLAQLARAQGDVAEALRQVEQALSGIDELRAGMPPGSDMRATFVANWSEAQAFRLDLLMQMHERQPQAGYATRAFDAAENGRARSLIELMLEVSADLRQNLDPQLLAREREVRERITANRDARELTQLMAEYNFVRGQIRQSNPRYAALTQVLPLQLADIQTKLPKLLDDRTLLLEYALGPERSWLFAVTSDSLHTFALPPRGELEKLVRRYYESLTALGKPQAFASIAEKQAWQKRMLREQQAVAAQLSQRLLAPAQALLPGKRLIIVPGSTLSYVPFAALPECGMRNAECGIKPKTLRTPHSALRTPLIVNHEIITLPSASTLGVLRRASAGRAAAPKTLALFADPVFDRQDERVRQAATMPSLTTVALRDLTASLTAKAVAPVESARAVPLLRLPASRQEAEAIAALVPESHRTLALDFDAARATVLSEDLSQYRYVHFATHGLLNNEHPELSGLALSLVDRQGVTQEGFLRTMDVFNLKLNAELVVLSGCQTALGKEIRGEGLVGLSRGFMYAGARRVLASLWQVNDAATAELMQRFYQGMLREPKLAPSAALRAAQLSMWRNPRWQAPYYWAAFTLQGEW